MAGSLAKEAGGRLDQKNLPPEAGGMRSQPLVRTSRRRRPDAAIMGLARSGGPWQSSRMRVLGFMTGTSLDAVDMAVLETDGEAIRPSARPGERKLSEDVRDSSAGGHRPGPAWKRDTPRPAIFEPRPPSP
jgi:hypothetical protein